MELRQWREKTHICSCGRVHYTDIREVAIGHGVREQSAEILKRNGFPSRILVVADQNTLAASEGLLSVLEQGGFAVSLRCYESFRTPLTEYVEEIAAASREADGILSVGTGSLNDICRRASFLENKEFAIFATAPSMDGFASATAPIIENGMKNTLAAKSPSVIMADTAILAKAPAELKAAGFGDIIGKYIALVDWRVAHLLVGEYYCEEVAELVRTALRRVVSMADRVCREDEETAGFLMETLILTGLAMGVTGCSRPASGAEHQISHYWGMKKLSQGKQADYHGKKVGVATLALSRVYGRLAEGLPVRFCEDRADLAEVIAAYGDVHADFLRRENLPPITAQWQKARLEALWPQIGQVIREELPSYEMLREVMMRAGAATDVSQIDVEPTLAQEGLRYHSFMRRKVVLTRLLYMTDADVVALWENS